MKKARIIKTLTTVTLLATASLVLPGCSSEGHMHADSQTQVGLAGNNYKIIKMGAEGESIGFKLLGLIPIDSPSMALAKQRLYQSVGEPLTGRAVALAHQTEDRSSLYLILFSLPRYTITADVVEFTDKSPSTK